MLRAAPIRIKRKPALARFGSDRYKTPFASYRLRSCSPRVSAVFSSKPVRAPGEGSPPVRVVYILGSGRSGSTVLDTVLGHHAEVVGVGELGGMHRAVQVNNEYCACGCRGQACPFWTAVLKHWEAAVGPARAAAYRRLQQRFERLGIAALVRLNAARFAPTRAWRRYLHLTHELYRAIAAVSGRKVVVDSSKNPLRAAVLAHIPELDLRLVHLVRDGRAVAWSVKKPLSKNESGGVHQSLPGRPAWRTIGYWVAVNLLAEQVKRRAGVRSTLIRYEDFVADPRSTLDRIGACCGLDLRTVAADVLGGRPLPVGHTIAGNRLRMAGSVRLQPDWEWMEKLPAVDRSTCWRLAGRMLRYYGYEHHACPPQQIAQDHSCLERRAG